MIFEDVIAKPFDWVRTFFAATDQIQPKNVSDTVMPVLVLNPAADPTPTPGVQDVNVREMPGVQIVNLPGEPVETNILQLPEVHVASLPDAPAAPLPFRYSKIVDLVSPYRPGHIGQIVDFRDPFFQKMGYRTYRIRVDRLTCKISSQQLARTTGGVGLALQQGTIATNYEYLTFYDLTPSDDLMTVAASYQREIFKPVVYSWDDSSASTFWGYTIDCTAIPGGVILGNIGTNLGSDDQWTLAFRTNWGNNTQGQTANLQWWAIGELIPLEASSKDVDDDLCKPGKGDSGT